MYSWRLGDRKQGADPRQCSSFGRAKERFMRRRASWVSRCTSLLPMIFRASTFSLRVVEMAEIPPMGELNRVASLVSTTNAPSSTSDRSGWNWKRSWNLTWERPWRCQDCAGIALQCVLQSPNTVAQLSRSQQFPISSISSLSIARCSQQLLVRLPFFCRAVRFAPKKKGLQGAGVLPSKTNCTNWGGVGGTCPGELQMRLHLMEPESLLS